MNQNTPVNDVIYKIRLYGVRKSVTFIIDECERFIRSVLTHSYSQCGEDIILDKILKKYSKGFYVDVGAYDPTRFSNTLRFYEKGWSGINIEPNVVQYNKFVRARSRDINLNIGVGSKNGALTYYQIIPTTLSTFSKQMADEYMNHGYTMEGKKKVPVLKLSDIFSKYAKNRFIHYISIDVEGYEVDVLKSNNWKKYRPLVICLEVHFSHINIVDDKKRELMIMNYLHSIGYLFFTKSDLNYFFINEHTANELINYGHKRRENGI